MKKFIMIDIRIKLNLKELYIPMRFLEYTFYLFWENVLYGLWLEGQRYCTCPQQEVAMLTIPKNFKKALQL